MDFFNSIYPERDGAMQASQMRFLLSIPEGKGKPLTKRTTVLLLVAAAFAVAILIAGAAWLGAERPQQLHEHMKPIAEAVGSTREDVFAALAENGDGMVNVAPGVFSVPGGCRISQTEFEVLLYFEDQEVLLDGYSYMTQVKMPPEKAAKLLRDLLGEYYNETITLLDGQKVPLRKKELTDLLSGTEPFLFQDSCDVTPNAESGSAVAKYIAHLQEADYWEGRFGEYLIKTANYYRDIQVSYAPQTQTLEFMLRYKVEADREK